MTNGFVEFNLTGDLSSLPSPDGAATVLPSSGLSYQKQLEAWIASAAPGDQFVLPLDWHSKAFALRDTLDTQIRHRNRKMRVQLTSHPALSFVIKVWLYEEKHNPDKYKQWNSQKSTRKKKKVR